MSGSGASELDRRLMAAAIRLSCWNLGLTATNPSVATLIVREQNGVPAIVGRGITAIGGRPHAETQALAEAGELARGATAYVTLEPCAHHGRTPPCAEALVAAGVGRVVGGAADPDTRVSGRGYAMLRAAGIEVVEGVLAGPAADAMSGYLTRSSKKRAEVTLKIAISADGMIGRRGDGQVAITGAVSRRYTHVLRAQSDAILIGIGTALADDPQLTVRLPGLEGRSPARVVLDRSSQLPPSSTLVLSAGDAPVFIVAEAGAGNERQAALEAAGVGVLAAECYEGRVALPELLEDMAARGWSSVLVEGGAAIAGSFLAEGLVDRLVILEGPATIGNDGVPSPILPASVDGNEFEAVRTMHLGDDRCTEWRRRS